MQLDNFEHTSGNLDGYVLALGWLDKITTFSTRRAVPLKPHAHNHMEVIFCLAGELFYTVNAPRERRTLHLTSRMGLVIPPDTIHSLSDFTESPAQRLGLHLASAMPPSTRFKCFLPRDYAIFRQHLADGALSPFKLSPALTDDLKTIAQFIQRPASSFTSPELGFIRLLCCNTLYRTIDVLTSPPAAAPQMMNEAVRYLKEHASEPISIDRLVSHMGYSRARLFTLFKEHTGLAPHEFLARHRIKRAQEILRTKKCPPIPEVATQCGFPNALYFVTLFKRFTGLTPRQYRVKIFRNSVASLRY